jgi:hypothetical protein
MVDLEPRTMETLLRPTEDEPLRLCGTIPMAPEAFQERYQSAVGQDPAIRELIDSVKKGSPPGKGYKMNPQGILEKDGLIYVPNVD